MRRRNIVVSAVVVVVVLALISSRGSGSSGPYVPNPTEAHLAAVLAGNVKDLYATDDWYVTLQQVAGLPNIEVVASTAFVFTRIANTDLGKANALTICHNVAAVTNDPDTAQPLGIRHVKVDGGSGNDELASCDPP